MQRLSCESRKSARLHQNAVFCFSQPEHAVWGCGAQYSYRSRHSQSGYLAISQHRGLREVSCAIPSRVLQRIESHEFCVAGGADQQYQLVWGEWSPHFLGWRPHLHDDHITPDTVRTEADLVAMRWKRRGPMLGSLNQSEWDSMSVSEGRLLG